MGTEYKVTFNRQFKSYDEYLSFYNGLLEGDIQNLFKVLHTLRLPNGFYKASTSNFYKYTWLRDNFFCSMPELWNNPEAYKQTYRTWLDYYKEIEIKYNKFSSLIEKGKIDFDWEFPNPRINFDLSEIHDQGWAHVQLDQLGYFLFGIAKGEDAGIDIIRDESDINIIKKVIKLLEAINYHTIAESGAWEENKENPRASTIGVIVAGLEAVKNANVGIVYIPDKLILNGKRTLNRILPNETPTRKYDLAQLFLIYPCNVLSKEQSKIILKNIEAHLLKDNGVNRYQGDHYYHHNGDAEWVFGLAYLGIIYAQLGEREKARHMYERIINKTIDYEVPELYYAGTDKRNDNSPLGWSIAMTIQLANILKS